VGNLIDYFVFPEGGFFAPLWNNIRSSCGVLWFKLMESSREGCVAIRRLFKNASSFKKASANVL
jgi:hypothetical protein